MTTKLKIEGMSCGHCVAAVREALEGVSGVQSAQVDLEAGQATVDHDDAASTAAMVSAVEEEGYDATIAGAE